MLQKRQTITTVFTGLYFRPDSSLSKRRGGVYLLPTLMLFGTFTPLVLLLLILLFYYREIFSVCRAGWPERKVIKMYIRFTRPPEVFTTTTYDGATSVP